MTKHVGCVFVYCGQFVNLLCAFVHCLFYELIARLSAAMCLVGLCGSVECYYLLLICVDGVWKIKNREKVSLGVNVVPCLLTVNREMWAACDASVHVISIASSSSSASSSKLVVTKVCLLNVYWYTALRARQC